MILVQNHQLLLNGNNQVTAKSATSKLPLGYKKLRNFPLFVIRQKEEDIKIYQ